MEIPIKYLPLLSSIEKTEHLLLWSSLGMMGLLIAIGILSLTWRKVPGSKLFNTVIFVSLIMTFILGFVLMIILHLLEIALEKMYLSWMALLFTCALFTLFNASSLSKFFDETPTMLKNRKNKND